MQLLIAVVQDLFEFAMHALFGTVVHTVPKMQHESVIFVAPRAERLAILAPKTELPTSLPHAHLETVFTPIITAPERNTVLYSATNGAPLRTTAEHGVDNVIERIPYGAMLVALDSHDGWAHVFHRGIEGYVELRDLADKAGQVYPKFVIGEENNAGDPNTERVRAIIDDTFSYGEGTLPLQAEEYILYKLRRNGVLVAWNAVRPRVAGTWKEITATMPNVEQSTLPRPRSVMEILLSDGRGHLVFIESVYPDGTLQLSEVNWPERGIYNERALVKEEWERLSPIFLIFS